MLHLCQPSNKSKEYPSPASQPISLPLRLSGQVLLSFVYIGRVLAPHEVQDPEWLLAEVFFFLGSLLGNAGMKLNKMDGYFLNEFPFFNDFFLNEVFFHFMCLFICWGIYEVKSSTLGNMFGIPLGTVAFSGFKLSTMAVAPERNSHTGSGVRLIRLQNFQDWMRCLGFVY